MCLAFYLVALTVHVGSQRSCPKVWVGTLNLSYMLNAFGMGKCVGYAWQVGSIPPHVKFGPHAFIMGR